MSKKPAFFIAGILTAIVMVLVLGVAVSANQANQASPVAAAATTGSSTTTTQAGVCVNPADVATLQSQLNDYQTALQQANAQLQAAYNQIAALQGQGGFSGERENNERGFPFGEP